MATNADLGRPATTAELREAAPLPPLPVTTCASCGSTRGPCEVDKYTAEIVRPYLDDSDGLTRNPELGRVVCGAGLGYLHKDHGVWTDSSLRTPQTFEALQTKLDGESFGVGLFRVAWNVATADGLIRNRHYQACADAACANTWATDTCPIATTYASLYNGYTAPGSPLVGDAAFDYFGSSLAMDQIGAFMLVGAHESQWGHAYVGDSDIGFGALNELDSGYARGYNRAGTTNQWSDSGNGDLDAPSHTDPIDGLTAPADFDNWGTIVKMDSTFKRKVVVGATQHVDSNPAATGDGYIVVYERAANYQGAWVPYCELPSYRTQPHADGIAVSIGGNFLIVGEPGDSNNKGKVTVYDIRSTACGQYGDTIYAPTSPSGGNDDDARWGWSVAIQETTSDLIIAISALAEDGYRGWVRTYKYDMLGGRRRLNEVYSTDEYGEYKYGDDHGRALYHMQDIHGTSSDYSFVPDPACVDTDNGVTDSYGDGCADGYSGGPGIDPGDHWCSTFHGYNGYDTFESGNWNPRCMCCWCGGGTTTTDPVCLPGGGANGVWNVLGDDQTLLSGANQGDMFGYRIHLGGGGEFLVVTAPGCYKHSGDGVNPNMQLDVPTCTTPTTSNGYARAFYLAVDGTDGSQFWAQIGSDSDLSGEKPGDYFGLSLAVGLHASRATIIVGAPLWKDLNFPGELRVGRVYAYAYDDLMTHRYPPLQDAPGRQPKRQVWLVAGDGPGWRNPRGWGADGRPQRRVGWVPRRRAGLPRTNATGAILVLLCDRRHHRRVRTRDPHHGALERAGNQRQHRQPHRGGRVDPRHRHHRSAHSRLRRSRLQDRHPLFERLGRVRDARRRGGDLRGDLLHRIPAAAAGAVVAATAAIVATAPSAVAVTALAPTLATAPAAPAATAGVAAAGSAPPAHAAAPATTPAAAALAAQVAALAALAAAGPAVRGRRQRRHVLALCGRRLELGHVVVPLLPVRRDARRRRPAAVGVAARDAQGRPTRQQRRL